MLYAYVVSSLCPVYFRSLATLRLPSTTLAIPSQTTHTGREFSRPVKSHSYRHSGQTDSTHRCCYECYYQRSRRVEENAEPSSVILVQFHNALTCSKKAYLAQQSQDACSIVALVNKNDLR